LKKGALVPLELTVVIAGRLNLEDSLEAEKMEEGDSKSGKFPSVLANSPLRPWGF
jgi:hypothetical protein